MSEVFSTEECAQLLKAMADDTRLRIIQSLFRCEKCGTDIAAELKLSQPHVAHHLNILKNANLVQSQREGQKVMYRLHPVVYKSIKQNRQETIDMGCCKISFPKAVGEEV